MSPKLPPIDFTKKMGDELTALERVREILLNLPHGVPLDTWGRMAPELTDIIDNELRDYRDARGRRLVVDRTAPFNGTLALVSVPEH